MGLLDRLFKRRPAERGPTCLACDSSDLEALAAEAYRCRACGHEGGDGLPAYLEIERVNKIVALAPEARRALAGRALEQASNILNGINLDATRLDETRAAAETLMNVGMALAGPAVVYTNDARDDRDRAVMGAVRELAEAERALVDCGHALDQGPVLERSITAIPTRQLDRSEVLESHRHYLRELHAHLREVFELRC